MSENRAWSIGIAASALAGCYRPPCAEPLVFGHRGTTLDAPENTVPAFEVAAGAGADGLEIDVHLSLDGAVVAIHDDTTGRTTDDGADRLVVASTLAELQALDAGSWFDPAFAGTRIPTADEVEAVSNGGLLLWDLKGPGIEGAIVELVIERSWESRSLFSSFSEDSLKLVHDALPEVPIVYYLSDMSELDRADEVGATWVRIPKEVEDDPSTSDAALRAGYLPAVSGHALRWDGGVVLANNPVKSMQRKLDREGEGCRR